MSDNMKKELKLKLIQSGLPKCKVCGYLTLIREEYQFTIISSCGSEGHWFEVLEFSANRGYDPTWVRVRCKLCGALYNIIK